MKLVSAVMPTRGRREYAQQALESFRSQDYAEKELVILDDEDDRSFPIAPIDKNVRYYLRSNRLNIPQKRNTVNALAKGEIIIHFDSDDWSAPERMSRQVAELESSGKPFTGFYTLLFYDERTGRASEWSIGSGTYVCGTSFCYLKSWADTHKYQEDKPVASDNAYCREASKVRQLHAMRSESLIVARIHADNTATKGGLVAVRPERIPDAFYKAARLNVFLVG